VDDPYYPAWLGGDLVEETLPWDAALATTLAHFFEQYSLHDSYWIGLYLGLNQEGVLLLRWDTVWTEGRVPFPGPLVAEWPVLAVRLSGLGYTDVRLKDMGISGAASGMVDARGVISGGVEQEQHQTVIDDHSGGSAILIHEPGVRILCFDRERNLLPIPLREKDSPPITNNVLSNNE
jgi:hypothetical protein